MLKRDIRHAFVSPRIIPFKYTSNGASAPTKAFGGDLTLTSGGGAGAVVFSIDKPFARNALVFASVGTDVADGGGCWESAQLTNSALTMQSVNASGSIDDGTVYGFMLGYDSANTSHHGKKVSRLVCNRRHSRMLGFQVDTSSSGSIVINSGQATISRTGTGDVTVTLNALHAFGSTDVVVVATPLDDASHRVVVESTSANTFRLKRFDSSGTAQDGPLNVIVIGFEQAIDHGGARSLVKNTQLKPRVVAGKINETGGTPAVSIGTGDYTIVDDGVGTYTVTFTNAFAREPIIVATSASASFCCIVNQSATGFRFRVTDAAGNASDDDCSFFALGSDSEVIY